MKPYQLELKDGSKMSIITPMKQSEIKDRLLKEKSWLVVKINGKSV